jgi:poly-gamma-glutamate capsule biosynthesis protein CapA/YwtB (metallophosphatase superfamily)
VTRRNGRVAFLGDVLLGRDAGPVLRRRGYDHALAGLRPLLDDADVVVANVEGPITRNSERRPKPPPSGGGRRWWMRSNVGAAGALARAGVGIASLANNHIMDYGERGLAETIERLEGVDIAHVGAGPDAAAARRPVVVDVAGLRVGFVAAMQAYAMELRDGGYADAGRPGPALLEPELLNDDLSALRADCDVVIALLHWGRNYRPVTALQRELAQAIAPSADLVVGHHSHLAQPVELVGGTPVLFGLGNAAYGMRGRFAKYGVLPYGMVVTAELLPGRGVAALEVALIDTDVVRTGYRAVPAAGDEAGAVLDSLLPGELDWRPAAAQAQWSGTSAARSVMPSEARCRAVRPPAARRRRPSRAPRRGG